MKVCVLRGWRKGGWCFQPLKLRAVICEQAVMQSSFGQIRAACQPPRWDYMQLIDWAQSPKKQCIQCGQREHTAKGFPRTLCHGKEQRVPGAAGRKKVEWKGLVFRSSSTFCFSFCCFEKWRQCLMVHFWKLWDWMMTLKSFAFAFAVLFSCIWQLDHFIPLGDVPVHFCYWSQYLLGIHCKSNQEGRRLGWRSSYR